MSESILIDIALCLPAPDVEALVEGRIIAAIPQLFIEPGRTFALCPTDNSTLALPSERYYKNSILPMAKNSFAKLNSEQILIQAWAKCELCQILDETEPLNVLSRSTIWTDEALQNILLQHDYIFMAYLQVYNLSKPIEVSAKCNEQFMALPQPINISEARPVLSERRFSQCKYQLENRLSSPHPELQVLQSIITQFANREPKAKLLDQDIKSFLGWSVQVTQIHTDFDIEWIKVIANIGNSSDGDAFEKLVRQSLIKLGFSNNNINPKLSLDPNSSGGAGGLDFYCEAPYPVVGECKATKSEKVPDGTAAQLVKLGYKHLQRKYNSCIKIIMAAGELTEDAELTASGNEMNVIRPETLQRMVELKAYQPGSIDLMELKNCLEEEPFGEAADTKVNRYIDSIFQNIKVRVHIIKLIKNADRKVGIEYISGAYDASNPPKTILNIQEMHEILIELSSPLTGYLGRQKGSEWKSDKFYYLRDLPTA